MPLLLHRVRRAIGAAPTAIVLTTPHYLPLAPAGRRATVRSSIIARTIIAAMPGGIAPPSCATKPHCGRIAALSIFVSEGLRARAVAEYGLDPARTAVSPNATEPRFAEIVPRPAAIASLAGPVFGAAGMLNSRIDLAFLAAVADDPRVSSLALVGPVEADLETDPALAALRGNAKVHFFGAQPHATMPGWMAAFDVAVVPYAQTPLNRFCSPMRLYDHLAIGQPIIATRHCQQIADHPRVLTGDVSAVPTMVASALANLATGRRPQLETWDDRIDALQKTAVAGVLFSQ